MEMKINGVISKIFDLTQITDKFKKREFIISDETNANYPQHIKFELHNDKCSLIDKYAEGQVVSVSFNVTGRKWTDPQGDVKYFNTLTAWKISGDEAVQQHPQEAVQQELPMDDLPF